MFEFPEFKFENDSDYLKKNQPEFQNNNNPILDVTNNANSISTELTTVKSSCYANILETSNKILDNKFLIDNVYFSNFSEETLSTSVDTNISDIEIKFEQQNETNNNPLVSESISEFSISNSFLEKIKNTTILDLENLGNDELDENINSETKEFPTSNNSEIKINNIIDIINSANSIKLSLSPKNTKPLEFIEKIEIQKEFIEKIKEIENHIEQELISEIDNFQNLENNSVLNSQEKSNLNNNSSQLKENLLTEDSYQEKLYKIENAIEDNKTLLISERLGKIYLPYKKCELENYIKKEPNLYKNLQEVIKDKFTLPFEFFKNQSLKSRFSETYNLLKNKDGENFMKSVSYAFKISGKKNLNPTIIASCKNKHELESYIYYLDSNTLNNFRFFEIIYEVNPLKK